MTTTGGQVKALLDPVEGLEAIYRRAHVPDDAALPYASFLDPISETPALSGDSRTLATRRLIQVDLWQAEGEEDDTLLDRVTAALDGVRVAGGFALRVQDVALVEGPETEEDIVHHSITVSLARVR